MKHYSSEQWADYVGAAAPKRESAEMKRHLEAGWKKCERAVGVWTTILELARKEPTYQPPDSAVRLAKSYFAMCRIEGKESLVAKVARLVFDSFRQPQLAGVRSIASAPHHYVYRWGPMLVDVWMESANESAPVALTGQIFDQSSPHQAVKDTVVMLHSGDADLSTTTTNQFGEFHLEFSPKPGAELHLHIGNDNKIAVLVPLRLIGVSQHGNDK